MSFQFTKTKEDAQIHKGKTKVQGKVENELNNVVEAFIKDIEIRTRKSFGVRPVSLYVL